MLGIATVGVVSSWGKVGVRTLYVDITTYLGESWLINLTLGHTKYIISRRDHLYKTNITGFRMQQLSMSSTHKYTTRYEWCAVSPNDNEDSGGADRTFTSVHRTNMRATLWRQKIRKKIIRIYYYLSLKYGRRSKTYSRRP